MPSMNEVVLNATSLRICVTITIINDLMIEGEEQFIVSTIIGTMIGAFELGLAQVVVTVQDDRKSV